MRIPMLIISAAASSLFLSCAQQEVTDCLGNHAQHEGLRYADEVAAQSPFETVEVSWSGALQLMEERNLAYRKAMNSYLAANQETPMVSQIRSQLKTSVKVSLNDVLKPQSLAKSFQDPITALPKQLGSISALKDISHEMEQTVWSKEGDSVEAKLLMRKEQVKLYTLLCKGEVIDREIKRIDAEASEPSDQIDPKLKVAQEKWVASVMKDRDDWIGEVRDFFNAEYYDVIFRKDASAKPSYRSVSAPDLTEWQRWCFLSRSQSLVKALKENHKKSKPAVPGTRVMKEKVAEMLNQRAEYAVTLSTDKVRGEVRTLISNWREMKSTQAELSLLDPGKVSSDDPKRDLVKAQKVYKLRHQEINHTSVVWMMDEDCWRD
ncbi:hypothetical protein BSZ32_05190 [Rubritalea profundi]|uniref:Lipoprotein n=2 Tax=Rubritalea profundi TaxID=1658618 RepID=A0A2S7U0N2_9BACT|nr:hypothetical protein BSZ32_05190 [Rubritalea profundi]